jgi:hypothetical protein
MNDLVVTINLPLNIELVQAIERNIDNSLEKLGFIRTTTTKASDYAELNYSQIKEVL